MLFFQKSFLFYFWCRHSVQNITAELRTISLYDSDLSLHNYNAKHRKFSMSSNSYYSGTESQQSISGRSYYDNVDESKDTFNESSRFLMPPKAPLRNSVVNRSKSFQETAHDRTHSPRVWLRRNLQDSSVEGSFADCSESPMPTPDVEHRLSAPPTCSCDKKSNASDSFYIRFLRRMRNLSHQLRKCKRVPRGTSSA